MSIGGVRWEATGAQSFRNFSAIGIRVTSRNWDDALGTTTIKAEGVVPKILMKILTNAESK